MKQLFRTKPINADHHLCETGLRQVLGAFDLALLGIGAIIGAGIFVVTGIAAATHAGPATVVSYIVAGRACAFSAVAYAELAATIGGCVRRLWLCLRGSRRADRLDPASRRHHHEGER